MSITVERIVRLAEEKGIKQSFIAEKIGSYRTVVNEWKRGKCEPSDEAISILAEFFDVSEAYLRGEEAEKEEATPKGQPLSPEKQLLLKKAGELSDAEIRKVLEYADFVKSQRKP